MNEQILKKWNDPFTAIEESKRMQREYHAQGYSIHKLPGTDFAIDLDDGQVFVIYDTERKAFIQKFQRYEQKKGIKARIEEAKAIAEERKKIKQKRTEKVTLTVRKKDTH